jgi:protein involved in polysaccharide export with SLBB domain
VGSPVSVAAKTPPPPADDSEEEATENKSKTDENKSKTDEMALTRVYRIGANDVLDIRVSDSTSSQSTLFTITPTGFLEHPLLGEPMQVGGLTVEEVTARIESDLKRRALDNTKVTIGVRDYASHAILVSGLVKDAGTKILRREAIPLYVVVADAQPLPEAARVTVMRNESNQLFDIELTQSSDMNLLVRPGDVVTLHANTTQFVYIGGEVKFPGEKTYRRGLTLTQAIISAGGLVEKPKEARLGRDDGRGFLIVTKFKLKDIESGKVPDPLVRPGDRITVID